MPFLLAFVLCSMQWHFIHSSSYVTRHTTMEAVKQKSLADSFSIALILSRFVHYMNSLSMYNVYLCACICAAIFHDYCYNSFSMQSVSQVELEKQLSGIGCLRIFFCCYREFIWHQIVFHFYIRGNISWACGLLARCKQFRLCIFVSVYVIFLSLTHLISQLTPTLFGRSYFSLSMPSGFSHNCVLNVV